MEFYFWKTEENSRIYVNLICDYPYLKLEQTSILNVLYCTWTLFMKLMDLLILFYVSSGCIWKAH